MAEEPNEFSKWILEQVEHAGGWRQAAEKFGLVHGTLLKAAKGGQLSLSTLKAISQGSGVDLARLLRMYGESVPEDRETEFALARVLDQRPELRGVLEDAVATLDDNAVAEILEYIRFRIQRERA